MWNWSWAPWLLSVVHIERTTASSSMHGPDVRPPVADLDPGLPALAIADLERIERLADVAVGVVGDDDPDVVGRACS